MINAAKSVLTLEHQLKKVTQVKRGQKCPCHKNVTLWSTDLSLVSF